MTHKFNRNKYNNKKTVVDGFTFDSKLEADYYVYLKMLEYAEEIESFERQVRIPLYVNEVKVCSYVVDFIVTHKDKTEYVDIKGFATAMFKLKWKMLKAQKKDEKNIEFSIIKKGDFR